LRSKKCCLINLLISHFLGNYSLCQKLFDVLIFQKFLKDIDLYFGNFGFFSIASKTQGLWEATEVLGYVRTD
jgi:hypothetical protein